MGMNKSTTWCSRDPGPDCSLQRVCGVSTWRQLCLYVCVWCVYIAGVYMVYLCVIYVYLWYKCVRACLHACICVVCMGYGYTFS